jgi:transcriptional regulator of acetoin/glycerol metabolism
MSQLPPTSFLQSHAARVDLARQRFFNEGLPPTGVVSDAVFESWSRCLRLQHRPREQAVFQPVSMSRTHLALQRNRHLHSAWLDEMPRLEAVLGKTNCAAMLTDMSGVLIGATCAGRAHEKLMLVATRMGVNLSEEAVGTTAPGVVARTGRAVSVQGAEHFFDSVKAMHCAAVPIHDIGGRLAGVLDISSEAIPFDFDALSIVGLYAAAIENRLLLAQSTDHLVIRFQVTPDLLDSALVGLVGIDSAGRVAWRNGVARKLLGRACASSGDVSAPDAESVLGAGCRHLASLPGEGATMLTLASGLLVWARAEMRTRDGHRHLVARPATPHGPDMADAPVQPRALSTPTVARVDEASGADAALEGPDARPPSGPASRPAAPATLRELDLDLIERTVEACGGNISEAARRLRVSRGLVYRRLRRRADSGGAPGR